MIKFAKKRNKLLAEEFIPKSIKTTGKNPVSTDGGTWYPVSSSLQVIEHYTYLNPHFEKSIVERTTVQYIKDRTNDLMTISMQKEDVRTKACAKLV